MQESIIIKPSVEKQFEHFMRQSRVLFFSAPCGFGKTVLADALLAALAECAAAKRGRPRLRDPTVSAGLGHSAD